MPRRKKPFTHEDVKAPEDLDRLDKEGLIAFLRSERVDRWALWDGWRRGNEWAEPVDLRDADLSGLDLHGMDFIEAHVEGASFSNANLAGAYLWEAYLPGACLTQADLRQAHLRDTDLSSLAKGGLQGVRLYQTFFGGVLSLRYEQFLEHENPKGTPTIWEHTEGRFSEAKDVYKTLKGYFENVGDYEGANWAYRHEQEMEKLMYVPEWARWMYSRWKWELSEERDTTYKLVKVVYWKPNTIEWLRLEIADKLAGYGLSLVKPLFWLVMLILGFGLIYWAFGLVTALPCGYPNPPECAPSRNFVDALLFSLGAMTTIDVGNVQPYLSHVGILTSVEALLGIALTGLFGFVLGSKLRNS